MTNPTHYIEMREALEKIANYGCINAGLIFCPDTETDKDEYCHPCQANEALANTNRAVVKEKLTTEKNEFGYFLDEMDVEAFHNMRDWLEMALVAKGAKVEGSGIGCGVAELEILLVGLRFNVSIKPLGLLGRELKKDGD